MATTYLGRGASTYYTTDQGGVGLGSEIVILLNSKINDKGGGGVVKNLNKLRDIICGSPLDEIFSLGYLTSILENNGWICSLLSPQPLVLHIKYGTSAAASICRSFW